MLKKNLLLHLNNFRYNAGIKNINKKSFSNLFNDELLLRNKEFAANFKESIYHKVFYDINLQNTLNSLYLINRDVENIVFIGPNPYLFLEKLPPSKLKIF